MICNIVVLLFILFMAFWWGSQGGFNALVHLFAVIVAGALTFAFWELLVLGFLIDRMPRYAWGVGLLALFALFTLIIRKVLDITIRKNLYFGQIANLILGALIGFISGALTAGIALLGVGYLPLDQELFGYTPLTINENVEPDKQVGRKDVLWWPCADDMAAGFFTHLSGNTFYSHESLAVYRPDLLVNCHITRLKDDPNSSPVTNPASVEIEEVAIQSGPLSIKPLEATNLGAKQGKLEGRICAITTKWISKPPGTYDGDGLVRIYPSQIRLGALGATEEEVRSIAPTAYSVIDPNKKPRSRILVPFVNDRTLASNSGDTEFTFIFIVPENFTPKYLALRGTRFTLKTEFKTDPATLSGAIGNFPVPELNPVVIDTTPKPNNTFESPLAGSAMIGDMEMSSALPRPIDRNMVRGDFTYSNDTDILNGNSVVMPPFEGRVDRKVKTDRLAQPAGTVILRAQFDPTKAASFLGSAVAAAASLQAIYITDIGGTQYLPIGFVWWKATGETVIKIDRSDLIRSAREIPFREVAGGADKIYLYWQVPKGARINGLFIGSKTHYDLDINTSPPPPATP